MNSTTNIREHPTKPFSFAELLRADTCDTRRLTLLLVALTPTLNQYYRKYASEMFNFGNINVSFHKIGLVFFRCNFNATYCYYVIYKIQKNISTKVADIKKKVYFCSLKFKEKIRRKR